MSKRQTTMIIEPPASFEVAEHILIKGHECGYCHGTGSFYYDERWGEGEYKVCPVCEGKGTVDAVIDIRWQPSE